jgi:hypothetical protein
MRRRHLSAAPMVVAVLVVVGLALALGACGAGGSKEEAKARPLPEEEKALRPGEYRSEEFKPSFSFRVGKGWSSAPLEASDVLVIAQGETKVIGFVNAQEVYKPTKTGTPIVVDAPEDMVGWFQQHPYLQTDKPEPVTVGGVKGVQFDVVVEDLPKDYSRVCPGCGVGSGVGIFRLSSGSLVAYREADKSRLIVLEDVKGETVTLGFSSPATEFDEFAPEAQKVIDTVKWTGS